MKKNNAYKRTEFKKHKKYFPVSNFKSKFWLDNSFEINNIKKLLENIFLRPSFIPLLKRYFATHLGG